MMDTQFQAIQRDDLTLTFAHVRSASAVLDVLHLPGVMRAEPFRVVAAELHAGDRSYRMPVTGIALAQTLRRFFDERGRPVAPPARGMLLSATVAEILRVRPGDRIEVDELESERRHFAVRIAGIVDEPLGVTAVMRLDDLDRRLGEPQTVNGTALSVDALAVPRLDAAIKGTPEIAGVGYRRAELENAQDTIGSSIGFVVTVLVFFAVVMSVGVVYNAARIALAERSVELATLRILGFDNNEVAVVLLGEHALLTALGIPLGIVLGYGLLLALVRTAFRTELYRVPFVITAPTCTIAVLTVATAAFLSAGIVRRRLNRLDLIAVLKGE